MNEKEKGGNRNSDMKERGIKRLILIGIKQIKREKVKERFTVVDEERKRGEREIESLIEREKKEIKNREKKERNLNRGIDKIIRREKNALKFGEETRSRN